jgi:hypothetical protein
MAYFAELDEQRIVIRVLSVSDEDATKGPDYLADDLGLGGIWVESSWVTHGGVTDDGSAPLRFNAADIGYTFSDDAMWASQGGAFIPPQPFPSWVLNPTTALWDAPVPMPKQGWWYWDEATLSWVEVTPLSGT